MLRVIREKARCGSTVLAAAALAVASTRPSPNPASSRLARNSGQGGPTAASPCPTRASTPPAMAAWRRVMRENRAEIASDATVIIAICSDRTSPAIPGEIR